ncbi:MAG: ATP-binding protein [bacterium]|nr:ATP-binding protein [bacterium]
MGFTLTPAEGENFIDRQELVDDMVRTLTNRNVRMGFALYGVRRVGKTSILKEVRRRLRGRDDIVPVYFSIWTVAPKNVSTFVKALGSEILNVYQPRLSLRYKAGELIKSPVSILRKTIKELKISTRVGEDIEFLLKFDSRKEEYGDLIKRVFTLPEQLARETDTRCILMLDEFPTITDLKNGNGKIGEEVLGLVRTLYEEQQNTILCISGSIQKTMATTALSSASPFYRQFLVRKIEPLSNRYARELITRNLRKEIGSELLSKIFEVTGGIPFYIQLIGKQIESMPETDKIDDIIEHTVKEEGDVIFNEEFCRMSPKEQEIIIAMVKSKVHSPREIANVINEHTDTISKSLDYLQEKGMVEKERRGFYSIIDPVFSLWIDMKYDLY